MPKTILLLCGTALKHVNNVNLGAGWEGIPLTLVLRGGERTWGFWERRTSALQPEESLEKIGYGKEIWKSKVAERREEDKEENGGQISYRDSKSV